MAFDDILGPDKPKVSKTHRKIVKEIFQQEYGELDDSEEYGPYGPYDHTIIETCEDDNV
jgi:hypothetical protein